MSNTKCIPSSEHPFNHSEQSHSPVLSDLSPTKFNGTEGSVNRSVSLGRKLGKLLRRNKQGLFDVRS